MDRSAGPSRRILSSKYENKKSLRDMAYNMRIMVLLGKEQRVMDVEEGSSPLDVIRQMALTPDAYLILRKKTPIPVDEVLNEGDSIKLIRVASGG